ncbi:MAG: 30S ribosomal protein S8e [Nanoarchaeota archaeon]
MSTRKGRKISGGKYIQNRKKKKYELKGQKINVKLGDDKRKNYRTMGGNQKIKMLRAKTINVKVSEKQIKKAEIQNVLETPSNRFLARQNILTKGTIVLTNLGKVRITNRPTQDGVLNGTIIS